MTFNQAASFLLPNCGPHRNRPIACVALDDPAYLERCVSGEARECAPGSPFHEAARLVLERQRENALADILAGHTLGAGEYRDDVAGITAHNRDVIARDRRVEDRKGRGRETGKADAMPSSAAAGPSLFGEA